MTDEPPDLGLEKALSDLSWDRVVAAVAARCTGPLRERLDGLPLAATPAEAALALRETAEARRLIALADPLPLDGIREVGRSLDRLERQGVLEGPELRAIASTLGAARVLRRFLARRRAEAPAIRDACLTDPTLDDLQEELTRAIEPDGTLADGASRELGRLRGEVANLRGRIVARLEQLLLQHADIVQDRFHTLREGRYVIPIRTDAHEKLQGIVHGTSGSGATVFVEPRAVVSQGNRLKMAEGELEREVTRILGILGARVRERLPEVRAAVAALDRADLRNASARLAEDLRGVVPELSPEPVLRLTAARHPLLVLDGADVVANDVELRSGHALVLSGPNAGGKTVTLKVLGLAALMARAGLPVAAGEESEVGFFDPVLSDIGDEQSIQKNLSTFSAHVTNLVRVLEAAGPRALVLLDEIATGTDPNEGAALACALIDALCRAGAAVAVTTHYERLKAMALEDQRIENASVGFDVAKMAPTFRLRDGVPGSSSALRVARRFGMPEDVLARALSLLSDESRSFDALVRQLEERFEALDALRAEADAERRAAARAREEAERALREVAARDQKRASAEATDLAQQLSRARGELKEARRLLRRDGARDEESLRAIRAHLERAESVAEEVRAVEAPPAPVHAGAPVDEASLEIGQRVYVPRLRTAVTVVDTPSKGRVRVASGPVKLWVTIAELRRVEGAAEAARPAALEAAAPAAPAAPSAPERARDPDNTLDVRGMRVDDALSMTESFLDRMFGRAESVGYIVHGVGSGALRDAIREHLDAHAAHYVARTRSGTHEEGGDRLTVVYLK
ncbi:MAG: Smr/MutS family protein [Sandaracinaceae bacterium]|nr:Smr/MutS family protein [Sandaracinaceae bacterium]